MMRGAKKDVPLTKVLRANGLLLDRRSFVGYQGDMTPHLYLKGEDVFNQRLRLWKKWTKKGESAPRCYLKLEGCDFYAAELDHRQGGNFRRCDCEHNLRPVCVNCHRAKHVNVKLQGIKMLKAVEDFQKLYPERV